jgi:P4 family phage/plasmid primase-like protien
MASTERGAAGTWRYLAWWRDGEIDLDATRSMLPCSDKAAALLVNGMWPDWVHHVPGDKLWYIWNGTHHQPDSSSLIHRVLETFTGMLDVVLDRCHQQLAAGTAVAMDGQPQKAIDTAIEQAWAPWAVTGGPVKFAASLHGMTQFSKLRERLAGQRGVEPERMLDRWPSLLNAANCVINLLPMAGEPEWYSHDPSLMMTYCLEASYRPLQPGEDPFSRCPRYSDFVWQACGKDAGVFGFLIKVLGYSLLGANPLKLLFFLSGPTNSGKSMVLYGLSTVLGGLAFQAPPGLVGKGERHPRIEATMRGKRLIVIDETDDKLHLDEVQVKRLTGVAGGYPLQLLYSKTMIEVPVSWLPVIPNNIMPSIDNLDPALRARIGVLPMGPTRDSIELGLMDRIVAEERDGILALMVWACREAMADNGRALLYPPAAVVAATQQYEREQNTVLLWMTDCCLVAAGNGHGAPPAQKGSDCLDDYRAWCAGHDHIPLGRNQFYEVLGAMPGVSRSSDIEHAWFWGFQLKKIPQDW